jgi:hypothetical protein
MRNPPAFDKFLFEYREQLIKVVPPEWLPEPVFVASAAAKEIESMHQSLTLAREYHKDDRLFLEDVERKIQQQIAKLSKRKQTRKGFKEYGAGHYGVVYPTQKPGIVCKITTDASEAQTVANVMSWDQQPYGMVRYYAVFQFAGSAIKRRPVYVLWRDEVQPMTLASVVKRDDKSWESKMLDILHNTKGIAHQARLWVLAALKREWKKSASHKKVWADIAWAKEESPNVDYDGMDKILERGEPYYFLRSIARLPFRVRMARVLYALRFGWRDLMSFSYGFHPGHALFTCLKNDMLLADVHANNVMKSMDGNWDVSDPGHMIELSDRYSHVKIPTL